MAFLNFFLAFITKSLVQKPLNFINFLLVGFLTLIIYFFKFKVEEKEAESQKVRREWRRDRK